MFVKDEADMQWIGTFRRLIREAWYHGNQLIDIRPHVNLLMQRFYNVEDQDDNGEYIKYSAREPQDVTFYLDKLMRMLCDMKMIEGKLNPFAYCASFTPTITYHCKKCNRDNVTSEPDLYSTLKLTLPEDHGNAPTSIVEMMRMYVNSHKTYDSTEVDKTCDFCRNKEGFEPPVAGVNVVPRILIIQISRFQLVRDEPGSNNMCYRAINNFIHFDKTMQSSDMPMFPSSQKPCVFHLFGVVNREPYKDDITNGHYFAYCRTRRGWYVFDDDRNIVSVKEICTNKNASCVLFYEREDDVAVECLSSSLSNLVNLPLSESHITSDGKPHAKSHDHLSNKLEVKLIESSTPDHKDLAEKNFTLESTPCNDEEIYVALTKNDNDNDKNTDRCNDDAVEDDQEKVRKRPSSLNHEVKDYNDGKLLSTQDNEQGSDDFLKNGVVNNLNQQSYEKQESTTNDDERSSNVITKSIDSNQHNTYETKECVSNHVTITIEQVPIDFYPSRHWETMRPLQVSDANDNTSPVIPVGGYWKDVGDFFGSDSDSDEVGHKTRQTIKSSKIKTKHTESVRFSKRVKHTHVKNIINSKQRKNTTSHENRDNIKVKVSPLTALRESLIINMGVKYITMYDGSKRNKSIPSDVRAILKRLHIDKRKKKIFVGRLDFTSLSLLKALSDYKLSKESLEIFVMKKSFVKRLPQHFIEELTNGKEVEIPLEYLQPIRDCVEEFECQCYKTVSVYSLHPRQMFSVTYPSNSKKAGTPVRIIVDNTVMQTFSMEPMIHNKMKSISIVGMDRVLHVGEGSSGAVKNDITFEGEGERLFYSDSRNISKQCVIGAVANLCSMLGSQSIARFFAKNANLSAYDLAHQAGLPFEKTRFSGCNKITSMLQKTPNDYFKSCIDILVHCYGCKEFVFKDRRRDVEVNRFVERVKTINLPVLVSFNIIGGTSNHTIAIFRNWILDSENKHCIPLTVENVHRTCGFRCDTIFRASALMLGREMKHHCENKYGKICWNITDRKSQKTPSFIRTKL
jgi:hypothetical protein